MNWIRNKKVLLSVVMFILLASIFASLCLGPLEVKAADLSYSELAGRAVQNNYQEHKKGTPVDGIYGHFGAYDAYVLTKTGADLSSWNHEESSFLENIISLADESIANEGTAAKSSAKRIAYEYLAIDAWGDEARAASLLNILLTRQSLSGNGSIDNSAFSDIPAFEALGRANVIDRINTEQAVQYLISCQDSSTGAWTSSWNDVMSTAQAVRTLHYLLPHSEDHSVEINFAIDRGCEWLKARQDIDGGFQDSSGFDDKFIDTIEIISVQNILGIDPAEWMCAGKTSIDYINENAFDVASHSFGESRNISDNTWALEGYRLLGAAVSSKQVLDFVLLPDNIEIAVGESQQIQALGSSFIGTEEDISANVVWSVNVGDEVAEVNDNGLVSRAAEGDFMLKGIYQGITVEAQVGTATPPDMANVKLRIEAPDYTLLPETTIQTVPGSSYTDVLLAGQIANNYTVEAAGGFVNTINELGAPAFYWMTAPYQADGYNDGDSFVMSGNGSTNEGELNLPDSTTVGTDFTVTVTTTGGQPVVGATVIYYTAENLITPTVLEETTDENGQLIFQINNIGTYFVAADKANTAVWPDPDNGLVRTKAKEISILQAGGVSPRPQGTTVRVKVTGKEGESLFALNEVTLYENDQWGITALGALQKTGLSYQMSDAYSDFVISVAGQQNEGLNGWMYYVNWVSPDKSAAECELNQGDTVEWWYSSNPGDLMGNTNTKEDIQLINENLGKYGEARLNLKDRIDQTAALAMKEAIDVNRNNPLIIKNNGVEVEFPPGSFETEDENLEGTLHIQIRLVDNQEKEDFIKNAPLGEETGIFEIGGRLLDLGAELSKIDNIDDNTRQIKSFKEPVAITIDLSRLGLSQSDIQNLSGVRYVKNENGIIQLIKLGGEYNQEKGTFTFYTDSFSIYGVVRAEGLFKMTLGINMLTCTVNGRREYLDVPPLLINNHTMVPLRLIGENMGGEVKWIEEEKKVEIMMENKKVVLLIGKTGASLDVPATIRNGRTYVPLRYVTEQLGAEIKWFPESRRIEIVK